MIFNNKYDVILRYEAARSFRHITTDNYLTMWLYWWILVSTISMKHKLLCLSFSVFAGKVILKEYGDKIGKNLNKMISIILPLPWHQAEPTK